MTSLIANFLWIISVVILITLFVDLFETSRARREARVIREVLAQLEIEPKK